jgi:hypothetical protein
VNAYQLNTQKRYVTVDHKLSHLTVGNAHPTVLQITLKKWPIFRRETFEKPQYCHCERSEAISKHVDNPQDCHVALLLAMTRIDQK